MNYKNFNIDKELFQNLHKINCLSTVIQGLAIITTYILLSVLALLFNVWWLWLIIWLLQGLILTGFLGGAHDCAHSTFVKSKKWNRIIGIFWASIILMNFSLYKNYHLQHHKYTRVEDDTEPIVEFKSLKDYFYTLPMWKFFTSFLQYSIQAYFNKFPNFIKTEQAKNNVKQDNIGLILWISLITPITILYPVEILFLYWIPMFLYPPMLFFAALPEHYGCEEGSNVLTNTRTIHANRFIRFIYFNGNYHAEHHLFPSIPGTNLVKLHKLVGHDFKYHTNSYILFHLQVLLSIIKKRNREQTKMKLDFN